MPSRRLVNARRVACAAAGAVFMSATTPTARAVVVADYEQDFQAGTPAPGWSYLWNAKGPLGNPDNYVPLEAVGGGYEPDADATDYDPAPGAFLVAGEGPVDPARFPVNPPQDPFGFGITLPPLPSTYVRPGQGALQAPNTIERAVILAYTFSPDDIASGEGEAFFTDYYFAVSATSDDPISARVYHHNDPTPVLDFTFPAGYAYQTVLDPLLGTVPVSLGTYEAFETVYVAIGPTFTNADGGDEMRLDFSLDLVPEPSAAGLSAISGLALLARRRRVR